VVRPRQLQGSVVIIVGATSGIGRATAHAFAERGATLVLAARSDAELDAVVSECEQRGATTSSRALDIGEPDAAEALLREAMTEHGRVDTWVNAAAVLAAGGVEDTSAEEVERIVRTNVLGPVYAARAALRQFRQQGGGVLINVSSMLGVVPNPVVPLYTMTKFGVRGLSLSLHHRAHAWPGVRVCVVLPGPIDTPMFQRAANHTGRVLRAIPPAIAPERVAAAIVSCARRPRRQVPVGVSSRVILAGLRVSPRVTEAAVARYSATLLVTSHPAPEHTGSVLDPGPPARVHGGWRRGRTRKRLGSSFGRTVARHA
jgi:short-subunit dehydrogenase